MCVGSSVFLCSVAVTQSFTQTLERFLSQNDYSKKCQNFDHSLMFPKKFLTGYCGVHNFLKLLEQFSQNVPGFLNSFKFIPFLDPCSNPKKFPVSLKVPKCSQNIIKVTQRS